VAGRSERDTLTCLQQAIVFHQPATLLPALDWVGQWPAHHPLFQEGQGLLAHWSRSLLERIATYQAQGRIPEAIALAQQMPPTSPRFADAQALLHDLYQAQQAQASQLFRAAQAPLQRQAWAETFQLLWQLQDLERAALRPKLAPQLAHQLAAERQAQKQWHQARQRYALGTPGARAEAIALASQIDGTTYVWQAVQPQLNVWCDELFSLARHRLAQGDTAGAIALVQAIAQNPQRHRLAQDWLLLAQASQLAQLSLTPTLAGWALVGLVSAVLATYSLRSSSPWHARAIAQRHRWAPLLAMPTPGSASPPRSVVAAPTRQPGWAQAPTPAWVPRIADPHPRGPLFLRKRY
jgi:hypothetical protein